MSRSAAIETTAVDASSARVDAHSPDSDLVQRARAGDDVAFAALVDRYKDPVANYCLRMVGDWDRAEDIAQETFVKFYRSLSRYRDSGQLVSYLFRIATNVVRSEQRTEKRRRDLKAVFAPTAPMLNAVCEPDTPLEREEIRTHVSRAIAELPLRYRESLVLHDIEGWTYSDIAKQLGTSEGTIKSRISRARGKLKDMLEPIWGVLETGKEE